jgi:hypothetical protein
MSVICDNAIVVDAGPRVDDGVGTDPASRLYHGSGHYHRTRSYHCRFRNDRSRMNRGERLEPCSRTKIEKFFAKPVSAIRGSDGNHEMRRTGSFDDCFQLVIRTQNRHAENIAADRFSCDNSGDLDWLSAAQLPQ